jgi:hypothetical protein
LALLWESKEKTTKEHLQVQTTLARELEPKPKLNKELLQKMRAKEAWFDDEIMNSFFWLLSHKYPKVGVFSSHFLLPNSLKWTSTQNTIKAFNNGDIDKILIPFHTPGHWTAVQLSATNEQNHWTFTVMDSLGKSKNSNELTKWLQETFPTTSWTFVSSFEKDHQQDGASCGPYSCLYAKLAAERYAIEQIDAKCQTIDIEHFRSTLLKDLEKDLTIIDMHFVKSSGNDTRESQQLCSEEQRNVESTNQQSSNETQSSNSLSGIVTICNFIKLRAAKHELPSIQESLSPGKTIACNSEFASN